jgi:subtilisin-like proprotein convertase family protein
VSVSGARGARRAVTILAAFGLSVAGAGIVALPANAAPTAAGDFSAKASAQIAALQSLKTSLSPSEKKLDSRLAVELRKRQGKANTAALPKVSTGVAVSKTGTTRITIKATKVTPDLLSRLAKLGAGVRFSSTSMRTVTADAPLSAMTTIASWTDVAHVGITGGAMTAREAGPASASAKVAPVSKETKEAQVAAALAQAQKAAAASPSLAAGSVTSEGDVTHAADAARARFKVTGVGVKVCVLSDGVDSLAVSQATGDLPADVDVLPGQEGSGDEGTAMLEIVHDLAPNAKLGFATAFISEESFAQNILDLRSVGHCDIIVDDVIYFHEDPFQDGLVAQSVNTVTADGAFYFSSAGNEGNVIDGTAGNYEGDFVNSGRGVGKFAGAAHDFDPGPGVQVFDPLSSGSIGVPIALWWADPLGAAADDYDVYEFDQAGNVVGFSQDVQDGNDDPFEIFGEGFANGGRLAVVKFSGADRYFQVTPFRGRFANSADGLRAFATPGVTRGHSAAVNAFSVAAAPAADPLPFDLEPGDPPNPTGPYPGVFTRQSKLERFTSDGPRRVFFNANGTPITPGNTTATGGQLRPKPDITAADGTSSSVDGFNPFFGTSAAAPHAAAIAALALSGNPGMTNADIRDALTSTALDLAPAGYDSRSGFGVIRADTVLRFTGATPQPLVTAGTPTATPVTGDGDTFLEPGEQATVAFPAVNTGDGTATGVSVVLTTDDSRATITPRAQNYGNIKAGETKTKNYTLTLAADYPNGRPVGINARITFAGRLSPTTSTSKIAVGQPSTTVQTFAYAGAPVAIPDANPAGASATVNVAGVGFASGVTFSIDGTTCTADVGATTVGLDHTFVSDLTGTLTAPDGSTATLFARNGGSGNNFCQVVFDDAAANSIAGITAAQNPYTGTYRPLSPLSALRGGSVDGTWTFHVVDGAGADVGSIRAFSLHITGFAPAGA